MSEQRFGITVTAKMRHADLWRAAKSEGSTAALARKLDMGQGRLGNWINLRMCPSQRWLLTDVGISISNTLLLLTGKAADELWPQELREAIRAKRIVRSAEQYVHVTMKQLTAGQINRLALPAPELRIEEGIDADYVTNELMRFLGERERFVVTSRYGIGCQPMTILETAQKLGISKERVRQIEYKALRHLAKKGVEIKNPDVRDYVQDLEGNK